MRPNGREPQASGSPTACVLPCVWTPGSGRDDLGGHISEAQPRTTLSPQHRITAGRSIDYYFFPTTARRAIWKPICIARIPGNPGSRSLAPSLDPAQHNVPSLSPVPRLPPGPPTRIYLSVLAEPPPCQYYSLSSRTPTLYWNTQDERTDPHGLRELWAQKMYVPAPPSPLRLARSAAARMRLLPVRCHNGGNNTPCKRCVERGLGCVYPPPRVPAPGRSQNKTACDVW